MAMHQEVHRGAGMAAAATAGLAQAGVAMAAEWAMGQGAGMEVVRAVGHTVAAALAVPTASQLPCTGVNCSGLLGRSPIPICLSLQRTKSEM